MIPNFRLVLLALIVLYVASVLFVHFRGRVRLSLKRQLTDHSGLFAPYNVFAYLLSAVPAKPYLDRDAFTHLDPLRDHWQTIRAKPRICSTRATSAPRRRTTTRVSPRSSRKDGSASISSGTASRSNRRMRCARTRSRWSKRSRR
jgi:hypothetical protein